MTREEFFQWLDSQNLETTKYTHKDYFHLYLDNYRGYEHVSIRVFQDGDIWRCISEYKVVGDRPVTNYTLTSKEPFAFEEEVLEWLKKKLEDFLSIS